jgi:putative FmdB family regulatory protein
MPIYEYTCGACQEEFERLVMGSSAQVACPRCGSRKLRKRFSTFGMSGVQKPFAGSSSSCGPCKKSSCLGCG